jgi:ABC-2 type transport system ATP-binding protein
VKHPEEQVMSDGMGMMAVDSATVTLDIPAEAPDVAAGDGIDIACAGVSKFFRDFWMRPNVRAVDGLDLTVRTGEIFGLLGPNGSGKSTTIKMLLGLLEPSAGRIAVLGRHPRDVAVKRHIGYLPEETYLYRFLTGRETLDYYARLFRLPRQVRRERVDMLLEMVGLEAVQHRRVGEYSKGMQRRIGLAQSLINDPHLLVLDEPTSGMDPVGSRQIKDLIASLAARGKTVLLCSHLLGEVEDLCDRVAIMYGGRLRASGTCDELLERSDETLLHLPTLDDAGVAKVRAALDVRHAEGLRVERPRRSLESLFLEIVERARSEGATTSGAKSGGRLAGFLDGDGAGPQGRRGDNAGSVAALAPSGVAPGTHEADHEDAFDANLIDQLTRRPS